MIFRILVHNLPASEDKIGCELQAARPEGQKPALAFIVDLRPFALASAARNRLKISCALLERIGKLYGVVVAPESRDGEIIRIRVAWEADEA